MSEFFGRDGTPMTLMEWAEAFERDPDARRVGLTQVGRCTVSTVWLGLDHAFGHGPPLLFETMVFDGDDMAWGGEQWRYTTEADAVAGHARVVELVRLELAATS